MRINNILFEYNMGNWWRCLYGNTDGVQRNYSKLLEKQENNYEEYKFKLRLMFHLDTFSNWESISKIKYQVKFQGKVLEDGRGTISINSNNQIETWESGYIELWYTTFSNENSLMYYSLNFNKPKF